MTRPEGANMQAVYTALASSLPHLARLDLDLKEIVEEFTLTEPYLGEEVQQLADVRGAIRLAALALRDITQQVGHLLEARTSATSGDLLTAPLVVDH